MTPAELSARLQALPPEQREALLRRLQGSSVAQGAISRAESFPASFEQEDYWLDEAANEGADPLLFAIRCDGPLDAEVLAAAFGDVVSRHEILRTTFAVADDGIRQIVHGPAPLSFPMQDLSSLAPADRMPQVRRLAKEEAGQPFDLGKGPLVRSRLVKLEAERHILIVTTHHTVFDGMSQPVFISELAALYAQRCRQGGDNLLAPAVQYGDYALAQRQRPEDATARDVEYWTARLNGAPLLELAGDRPRPLQRDKAGGHHRFVLGSELSRRLRELGRSIGASPFPILLASFGMLLSHRSGEKDVVFGTTLLKRWQAETESLLGPLIVGVPIRIQLEGVATARDLFVKARSALSEAFEHANLPYHRIARCAPTRNDARAPLFHTMIIYSGAEPEKVSTAGLAMREIPIARGLASFDVTVVIGHDGDQFTGQFEYARSLFDPSTIERMADHLIALLSAMTSDPGGLLRALPSMGDHERRLLASWNDTQIDYGTGLVHEITEHQAEATPDAIALVFEGATLTYRQLNERANRLAHALRRAGVAPDSLVGIALHRSLDLIVAVLAVLKAGGAYVPLDLSYPEERLRYVMVDADVRVVLTTADQVARIASAGRTPLVLDDGSPFWSEMPAHNPATSVTATNLAYVIYTSGSTGRPHGTLNTHQGIFNRLVWMQRKYRLDASDVVMHKTPIGFDVSVWELLWAHMYGAKVAIAAPEGHRDPSYIVDLIARERVTTIHFVPSMLQAFIEQADCARCGSLRRVICSGEALSWELKERFFEWMGPAGAELDNLYGPTEAAIDVSAWHCKPGGASKIVPIGRPIANTTLYVLDGDLRPVPIGVTGELFIGGVQLARGYLNQPDLTSERFLKDPFTSRPDSRIYRTGDLARWLPDGTIGYLGRIDSQVKIRGQRVELGEIEAVLLAQDGVRGAAVSTRALPGGALGLVGYVVGGDPRGADQGGEALRAALGRALPDYMVPSAIVFLDELPLSASGKLDRRALPKPPAPQRVAKTPPRDAEERGLAQILANLVGVEEIGIDDNFFDIGGDSLLAMKFVARVRSELSASFSVRDVMRSPTIRELRRALDDGHDASTPECRHRDHGQPVPLSFAQLDLWHREQREPGTTAMRLVGGYALRGALDRTVLATVVDDVFGRQEILRTTFTVVDGKPRQIVGPAQTGVLETFDAEGSAEADGVLAAQKIVTREFLRPMNLATGPLARILSISVGGSAHFVAILAHRMVLDGFQFDVLFKDICAQYEAALGHAPAAGPGSNLTYTDYTFWQRDFVRSAACAKKLAYWKGVLGDAEPLNLPFDRPVHTPAARSAEVHTGKVAISDESIRALDALAKRENTTDFVVLSAMYAVFLAHMDRRGERQESIFIVPAEMWGSMSPALYQLYGPLGAPIALRSRWGPGASFRDVLRLQRDVVMDAYAAADVPGAMMLGTESTWDSPLCSAVLNYLGREWPPLPKVPGLALSRVAFPDIHPGRMRELVWSLTLKGGGVLVGAADRFEASPLQRLATVLAQLVAMAIEWPDLNVGQLFARAAIGAA